MPSDNRNKPPKTDNKKVNELTPKKGGNASKDEQVKGGMMKQQPRDMDA